LLFCWPFGLLGVVLLQYLQVCLAAPSTGSGSGPGALYASCPGIDIMGIESDCQNRAWQKPSIPLKGGKEIMQGALRRLSRTTAGAKAQSR